MSRPSDAETTFEKKLRAEGKHVKLKFAIGRAMVAVHLLGYA